MPKQMITHSCGHVFRHNITGSEEKRAARQGWLAGQLCVNCRRIEDKKKVATFLEDFKMPALKPLGLNEQEVGWAESIRMGMAEKLFSHFDRQHDQVHRIVKSEKSARYWLGKHRANPLVVLRELGRYK